MDVNATGQDMGIQNDGPADNVERLSPAPAPVPYGQYPSAPDADGFFFFDEQEEAMSILTKNYDNGNIVKKAPLKNGRTAIVRELTGADVLVAQEIAGDKDKRGRRYQLAVAALATKVDGVQVVLEDLLAMKASDMTKISSASALLNFL